jgi:hypothetical protein
MIKYNGKKESGAVMASGVHIAKSIMALSIEHQVLFFFHLL